MLIESDRARSFRKIYKQHSWGGLSKSGPGSDETNTSLYCNYVNMILTRLKHKGAQTITEIGCGDWSVTEKLDVSQFTSYLGIDIVPDVVAANKESFEKDHVSFKCQDVVDEDLMFSDIIIMKDVLQHLSNDSVFKVIKQLKRACNYLIVTNDVKKERVAKVLKIFKKWAMIDDRGILNEDIDDGASRPIDLKISPFNLRPVSTFRYYSYLSNNSCVERYTKEILLLDFSNAEE